MPKLHKLTEEEVKVIKTRAEEVVYDDCKQDNGYLRDVVDSHVDGLDTESRLDAICNDRDMLPDVLGFDPYEKED